MKKILVTGGAGFIGAHTVVELINAGLTPIIVDDFSKSDDTLLKGIERLTNTNPTFYKGDCTDASFLKEIFKTEKLDAVIHFAAYKSVGESVEQPVLYYRNNIDSLLTLLEVMRANHVKNMIFSSSCTVYGEPDHIPVGEDAPFKKAESPYGATKQMCERILEDSVSLDFKIVSLRYFNPIGAHPSSLIGEIPLGRPNNLVPFITQTAIGKREKLTVFGSDYNTKDGSCVRDYIHVVDLADAHVKALTLLKRSTENFYDVFNVGTGIGVSVLELIHQFEVATAIKLKYEIGPRRSGDVEKTYADPSKIMKTLGWKPQYSNAEALLHAWNWEKKLAGI